MDLIVYFPEHIGHSQKKTAYSTFLSGILMGHDYWNEPPIE